MELIKENEMNNRDIKRSVKDPGSIYWRYKKNEPPIDEFAHLNGEVKIIKQADKLDASKQ